MLHPIQPKMQMVQNAMYTWRNVTGLKPRGKLAADGVPEVPPTACAVGSAKRRRRGGMTAAAAWSRRRALSYQMLLYEEGAAYPSLL